MARVTFPVTPFHVMGTIYRSDGFYWNIIAVIPTQSGTFEEAVMSVHMWSASLLIQGKSFTVSAFAKMPEHLRAHGDIILDMTAAAPTITSITNDSHMVKRFGEWMTADVGGTNDNSAKSN